MAGTSIRIEADLRPSYYDGFRCILGACQYNCCDEDWCIKLSKQDYLKVKHAPKSPELEELTRKSLRRLQEWGHSDYYAEFRANEAWRCPFHTPEGLCRLQLECGEETLPKGCRIFPRDEAYMPSGYLERALSPSCEGVLALLWDLPEGTGFLSNPLPAKQCIRLTPDKGNPLSRWFLVVREWCIELLRDRRFTLPQRIFLMGMGLKKLADGEENIERWIERAAILSNIVDVTKIPPTGAQQLGMYLLSCEQVLMKIRANNPAGKAIQEELLREMKLKPGGEKKSAADTLNSYRKARTRYEERSVSGITLWKT